MALCGGIVLEEALDLSFDRLLMMMMMVIFINLCMFRATMGPSSREATVFLRHLVLVIVCG